MIKLYTLLKTFSREDLKQAKKFLASPYFNTDGHVVKLFDRLCRAYPDMEAPQLENERLFKFLFPNLKEYDDHKLRNLRSKLTKLLERFLIENMLQKSPYMENKLLVAAYREAGLFPYFKVAIESGISSLKKAANRGFEYHQEMAWLLHELYFHPETPKSNAHRQALFELIGHVEHWFTLQALCYSAELDVRQNLYSESMPSRYKEVVEQLAGEHFGKKSPPVRLLWELSQTWANPDLKMDFSAYQARLLEKQQQMGPFPFAIAWKLLIAAGVARSNRGEAGAARELLGLFHAAYDLKLDGINKSLEVQAFLNCVMAGSHAGEFEWVAAFIKENKAKFSPDIREKVVNLSYAILYYKQAVLLKDKAFFPEATDKLAHLQLADEVLGLTLRPLILRIYYDSMPVGHPDIRILFDWCKNAISYFNNHQALAVQKRKEYKTFVRYVKLLARLKGQKMPGRRALANLGAQLGQEQGTILKHWLVEKLEELKNPSSLDWLQS
ncbi:MAG: hypothetical protein R2830_25245 [Saprospiraceae bacterium]